MKLRRIVAGLAAIGLTLLGFGSCRTNKAIVDNSQGSGSMVDTPQDTPVDSSTVDRGYHRIDRPVKLMYGVRPRMYRE